MIRPLIAAALSLALFAGQLSAQDKKEIDLYDYAAQKSATGVKKIVFVADTAPHGGRGNHEFHAAAVYLARTLHANYPKAHCVIHCVDTRKGNKIKEQWPTDLKHADSIIVLLNHARSAVNPAVKEATERGAGFMAIHYGVEVEKGEQGDHFKKWIGGYFEAFWSVNPHWSPEFKEIPKHETTRGVKPFTINDEWYYHMRFVDGMKGVTPVLSALPSLKTIAGEGKKALSHGGNPDVYKDVADGKLQAVAWAFDRPDGGRGFGFTGLHNHKNLANDSFRTLLLNACAWVSKLPVPEAGVPSTTLDVDALNQLMRDGDEAVKKRGL